MKFAIYAQLLLGIVYYCGANSTSNDASYAILPRFWTGSGFSPNAPLPFNRTSIVQQLTNDHVSRNLEFVAALPNSGIKYMRIHWLLSLVDFR